MKILILLFVSTFAFAQSYEEPVSYEFKQDLEIGETYSVFGDNVAFRTTPDRNSEPIDFIKIGEEVEILSKTDVFANYDGLASPYYKVKHNDEIGYVLGGLLAFTTKKNDELELLFAFADMNDTDYLQVRNISNYPYIDEYSIELRQYSFSINLYGNRGIKDLDAILDVYVYREACGEIGGHTYLFYDSGVARNSFYLDEVSDAGEFWLLEEFIFPDEEGGIKNKILVKRSEGTLIDWKQNWTKETIITKSINWFDDQVILDIGEVEMISIEE